MLKQTHPRDPVVSGDGAQQGAPDVAGLSAGLSLPGLWPVPSLAAIYQTSFAGPQIGTSAFLPTPFA